jgi:hypothetical protein
MAFGVAADSTGVYVVGQTDGVCCTGYADAFIRKFNSGAGAELWRFQLGFSWDVDAAHAVAVDDTGAYVVGWSPSLGGTFILKTDIGTGKILWTRSSTTRHVGIQPLAIRVAVDSNGVYLMTSDTVERFDRNGTWLWVRGLPGYGRAVAADPTGVYVVGATERTLPGQTSSGSSDAFVTKYDSKGDQKWIRQYWLRQFGTTEADCSFGVAVEATGAYVLGQTAGSLPGYANAGRFDAFLAKLN